MSDKTDLANVLGMKRVELTQADLDSWADHAEQIRTHLSIAAREMITIGRQLIEVKAGLRHGKFLLWIWRELNMTPRTANRFMNVAAWIEGKSDTVSNLQPSVLYLLASSETPSEITDDVIARAEKGETVKAAEVKRQIKRAQAERTAAAKTEVEDPEAEVSIETALAYFWEPATSREDGIKKIREFEEFLAHVAADAERAAQEECTEPEPSGTPSKPRKPTKPEQRRRTQDEIERDAFIDGRLSVLEQAASVRDDFTIPKLSAEEAEHAIKRIREAEACLRQWRRQIEKQHPSDVIDAVIDDDPLVIPAIFRREAGS